MDRFCRSTSIKALHAAALGCALACWPVAASASGVTAEFAAPAPAEAGSAAAWSDEFDRHFAGRRFRRAAAAPAAVLSVTGGMQASRSFGAPAVLHIAAGEWQPGAQAEYAIGAHITVSRAADALGAPIDFTRPIGQRSRMTTGPAYSLSLPAGLPVASRAMTSGFGLRQHPIYGTLRRHSGIDLAAPTGAPIVATSDGVVSTANWSGGYGLLVALEHGGGLQTRYGHMSRVNVLPGQRVRRGDVIGFVGSTGNSTGPHLHYEMRVNGQAINPAVRGRR